MLNASPLCSKPENEGRERQQLEDFRVECVQDVMECGDKAKRRHRFRKGGAGGAMVREGVRFLKADVRLRKAIPEVFCTQTRKLTDFRLRHLSESGVAAAPAIAGHRTPSRASSAQRIRVI
jgi:hypothetical protein